MIKNNCYTTRVINNVLVYAAKINNSEILLFILENAIHPRFLKNDAIKCAIQNNNLECVKILLSWIYSNCVYFYPKSINNVIEYASFNQYHKILDFLLNWRGPNGERTNPKYTIQYSKKQLTFRKQFMECLKRQDMYLSKIL